MVEHAQDVFALQLLQREVGVVDHETPAPLAALDDALGQIVRRQDAVVREDDRALDHVFELTHVPGPVVGHQAIARLLGDRLHLLPLGELLQEMLHHLLDVFLPLAERRKADLDHVQPVEEVGAEGSFGHAPLQVGVGRGDEADVDLPRLRASHRDDLPFL